MTGRFVQWSGSGGTREGRDSQSRCLRSLVPRPPTKEGLVHTARVFVRMRIFPPGDFRV